MNARCRNVIVLAGLCLLASTGCHRLPASWVYTFTGYPDEPFVTPGQKMEEYRQLASNAGRKSPTEREQVANQLAQSLDKESDPLVRVEIVRTLGSYPNQTSANVLYAKLKDDDKLVRVAACDAWGKINAAASVQALAEVLQGEKDVDVRLAAARSLGQLKQQPGVVQALAAALEDKDVAVQSRAIESLELATGRYLGKDANAWRAFAAGQPVPEKQRSLAERFKWLQ